MLSQNWQKIILLAFTTVVMTFAVFFLTSSFYGREWLAVEAKIESKKPITTGRRAIELSIQIDFSYVAQGKQYHKRRFFPVPSRNQAPFKRRKQYDW